MLLRFGTTSRVLRSWVVVGLVGAVVTTSFPSAASELSALRAPAAREAGAQVDNADARSSASSTGPVTWTLRSAPADRWRSVAWSPQLALFAAVAEFGSGSAARVMTSPNGINWTRRMSPNIWWGSVTWSPQLGLFAAVAFFDLGGFSDKRAMTSPDGINWTLRTTPPDGSWTEVIWAPELGLFVATATSGPSGNRVMTSPDGITWTLRPTPESPWTSVAWSPELRLLVAVAQSGTQQVMTSSDGLTWTLRATPPGGNWQEVAWSPDLGLFVAAGLEPIGRQVMTSPDGINWTLRSTPGAHTWTSLAWAPQAGLFAAVSQSGGVMTSPDGIDWTLNVAPSSDWFDIAWSPELGRFVVVSLRGFFPFVMTGDAGPPPDFGTAFAYTFGAGIHAAFSRDPVNLGTGSLTVEAKDLGLPSRVLGFAFSRWYNSADPTSGPLGPGWTHSYNWSLADAGGTVEIRRGDGRRDLFSRNADGTYTGPPSIFDTLSKEPDGSYTLLLTNQVRYLFSSSGRLLSLAEPAGNQIALAYTGANLTAITDTVGRVVTLSYDAQNRLVRLQDPLGRATTYAYDTAGRLAVVTDRIGNGAGPAAAHQWRYGYDGGTRHITSITDPDSRVRVTNVYDSQGRVTDQRDALGARTTIIYGGDQTVVTDPRLHATAYSFDSRRRVVSQTDQVGAAPLTLSYTYDAAGNRTSVTDRNGKRTDLAYDARGNVVSKTDPSPDGVSPRPVTTFAYDAKNNLTQVTDATGFQTALTYDTATSALLSVTRQIDATTGAKTTYEYADTANPGLPTRIVAPRGNTTVTPDPTFSITLAYDAQGNLIRRTDADNAVTIFTYDAVGRLVSFVDPDGNAAGGVPAEHTWLLAYDELDRETSRTDPLGAVMQYAYDGVGNRSSLTDRNANVTTYTYDANGRIATVEQRPDPSANPALVYTTRVTRDANGNATRVTQANGVATDYGYDALDRLLSVTRHPTPTAPLTTNYALDGNGQPLSRTTGDGVTVTFIYDNLSRLTTVGAPGLAISYVYDALGRRMHMTDATGVTTYQYDGLGRLTQTAAPNGTLGYVYDRDGNRTRLTYPGNQSVNYIYSPGGRLTALTDWANRTSRYTYKPSGLVSTLTYPNAMVANYTYDFAQRLTQLSYQRGTVIASERYTLDPEGNRVALEDLFGTTPRVAGTLRYDGLERLTSFERHFVANGASVSNESFSLDAASNIASRAGPAASYTYDGANRLTSDGTRSFIWDGADHLTLRGSDGFGYDPLGRMTSSLIAGTTRTYSYDGDGLLRSRSQGSSTTSFLYDPSLAPAPLLVAGTERLVYGLGPLYRAHQNNSYDTFVRDGLGSVRVEVSGTGQITNAYDHLAYGQLNASTQTPLLGFAGELTDPSGLIYLRARWYDPGTGRFMTSDPVSGSQRAPESLNRFIYAAASPAIRTDSSGLCTDPGGPGVRYCIDRFIPTGSSCVLIICLRGDNRGPMAESAADSFRTRQLILSDGSVRSASGTTRLEPFGWPSREGPLEGCTGQTDPSSVDVSCSSTNGLIPLAPAIHTRVWIKVVDGRVVVTAAGSRYPSLEVWRYGGSAGPQLIYFYDARAAAPFDLYSVEKLPNNASGGK